METEAVSFEPRQYPPWLIAAVWAAAALPMGMLGWVVAPALARGARNPGLLRLAVLTVGLVWQFALVVLLLSRENGGLKWAEVRRRLLLVRPSGPRTGRPAAALWTWLVPLVLIAALFEMNAAPALQRGWTALFPFLREPAGYSLAGYLGTAAGRAEMAGAWGTLALFVVNAVFNTFLGEELLFRGLLLPRMRRACGRWAWVANGILFGLYHLHQPWRILHSAATGTLLYALPTTVFRSTWFGIVLHSGQSVFFTILLLGLVLGLG